MKFLPIFKKIIPHKKSPHGQLASIFKKWQKAWISTLEKQNQNRINQMDDICVDFEKFNLEQNPESFINEMKQDWKKQNKNTLKKINTIKNKYGSSTFSEGLWRTICMVVIIGIVLGISSSLLTQNYYLNQNNTYNNQTYQP